MHLACTVCMAMFGNGAAIGMVFIQQQHKTIQPVHQQVRRVWLVVEAGATMPSIAVLLFATTAARPHQVTI